VRLANAGDEESNPENHVGSQQDTRKNPHVIDAGFEQNILASYWYFMLTGISTILDNEIYVLFA